MPSLKALLTCSMLFHAAYRFARGEQVTSTTGLVAQLDRPLDFLVIADHSDGMGFFGMLASCHPRILEEELGRC